jgi:hypothetical protein
MLHSPWHYLCRVLPGWHDGGCTTMKPILEQIRRVKVSIKLAQRHNDMQAVHRHRLELESLERALTEQEHTNYLFRL